MTLSIQCQDYVCPLLDATWKQVRGEYNYCLLAPYGDIIVHKRNHQRISQVYYKKKRYIARSVDVLLE